MCSRSALPTATLMVAMASVGIAKESAQPRDVTFSRDIAPLMYRSCSQCHHAGEAAPFSLMTYEDASQRARQLAKVVEKRIMPPWMPAPSEHPFMGQRTLSAEDIALFQRWAELGAPEGDPAQTPPAPVFTSGWKLGEPDIVLEMSEDFEVYAEGPDIYHNFALPLSLPAGTYLRALEFQPSNRALVHHTLICLDTSGSARRNDQRNDGPGFPGMRAGILMKFLIPYAPGAFPRPFPKGVTLSIPDESDLVLFMHFHPTGKPEKERSKVGLYLTTEAPKRFMTDIPVPFAFGIGVGIDIPPGEKSYTLKQSFTIPVECDIVGYVPHAHGLCVDMKGRAHLPDGTVKELLWIPNWDFSWQDEYRYETPLRIPANTRIEAEYTYDNSVDNPDNPNYPPQRVQWGQNSSDEMMHLGVQVMPVHNEDLVALEAARTTDRVLVTRRLKIQRYSVLGGVALGAMFPIFAVGVLAARFIKRRRNAVA